MFMKPKEEMHARPARRGEYFSVISADVTVTGNIASRSNLQVNGRIEGDVRCAALIQGEEGVIVGSIVADEARLAGLVDGTVTARLVVLAPSARITGDVSYAMLSIESGARVAGRFSHQDGEAAAELLLTDAAAQAAG